MNLIGTRYYYETLNAKDKRVYDNIYNSILSRKLRVNFRSSSFNFSNFRNISEALLYDNPQLFYVNLNVTTIGCSLLNTTLPLNYFYSSKKSMEIEKKLIEVINEIIESEIKDEQTEYEKVFKLHERLRKMIEYDNKAANTMLFRSTETWEAQHIVGALVRKKCVCEGYAKAMNLLCTLVGIESLIITGKGNNGSWGSHAWNLVKIDGNYYHVDVTWDREGNQRYFCLSDKEIEDDHKWDRNKFPKCNNKFDKSNISDKKNNSKSNINNIENEDAVLNIRTQKELERVLYENFMNEEEAIRFKIYDIKIFDKYSNKTIDNIIDDSMNKCKYLKMKVKYSYTNDNYYNLRVIYEK